MNKIKLSLSRINYRMFMALLVLGLAPTVYNTVRVNLLGQLPGEQAPTLRRDLAFRLPAR